MENRVDAMRVFGSVVVVAFQIAFRAEIHANDVFLFFKNHFWYQHIKMIQKVQTALNFNKKKKKIWNSLKSRLNSRAKRSLTIRPTFLLSLSLFFIYKVPYTCRHKHEKLNDYLLCEKIMKRPRDPLTILKWQIHQRKRLFYF